MLSSLTLATWGPLLPGIACWALALYLPLSLRLAGLEERLAAGSLGEAGADLVLAACSLTLALAAGLAVELLLGWCLGPGWATSLGVLTALWGLFFALAARGGD
jgi:hypothetical protein